MLETDTGGVVLQLSLKISSFPKTDRAKLVRAGITTKSTKPLRSPAKLDLADRERTFADNAVRKWKIELTMV